MRSPLRILLLLVVIMLSAAACTTTAVSSDERPATDTDDDATAAVTETAGDSSESPDETGGDEDDSAQEAAASSNPDDDQPSSARDLQSAPGFRLGGAEQLGALSEDCIDGNDMACDILFQVSGFDSDEEATAISCGGRSDVEVTFCTEGIEVGATELVFDEGSDGLPTIIAACREAGDMTACDFLFFRSPLASDTEAIGATCGERVEIAVPDCRTFLTDAE